MQFLEETYEERDGYNILFIRIEPFLDPLRGDPRSKRSRRRLWAENDLPVAPALGGRVAGPMTPDRVGYLKSSTQTDKWQDHVEPAEHRRTPRRKRRDCARNSGHVVECGGALPLLGAPDSRSKKLGTFVAVFTCTKRLAPKRGHPEDRRLPGEGPRSRRLRYSKRWWMADQE